MTEVVMLLENNGYPADVRVRREAESLVRAGYGVTVLAPRERGQSRRETVAGVRVRRFRLPRTPAGRAGMVAEYAMANVQLHLGAARALLRGARVVHLHNPPDTLFGVAAAARLLGRRVVYDQHDLAPELFTAKFGPSGLVRVLLAMERATFRLASAVVVPNESHREVATTRGGVPAERVAVVRNGPPLDTLVRAPNGRRGKLSDPHLLFLGSMEDQDGVDQLPRLLSELAGRHGLAGARLTLVGDGSGRPGLVRALADSGHEATFTGHVAYTEVPRLLSEADICLDPALPNGVNERSTMVKITEYLAAAKPVVAHRLLETERTAGAAALYTREPDAGHMADRVARLAGDAELRDELASRALARARDLVWERSEAALLEVYGAITRR